MIHLPEKKSKQDFEIKSNKIKQESSFTRHSLLLLHILILIAPLLSSVILCIANFCGCRQKQN